MMDHVCVGLCDVMDHVCVGQWCDACARAGRVAREGSAQVMEGVVARGCGAGGVGGVRRCVNGGGGAPAASPRQTHPRIESERLSRAPLGTTREQNTTASLMIASISCAMSPRACGGGTREEGEEINF